MTYHTIYHKCLTIVTNDCKKLQVHTIFLCKLIICGKKLSMQRKTVNVKILMSGTDGQYVRKQLSLPAVTLGWPGGSIWHMPKTMSYSLTNKTLVGYVNALLARAVHYSLIFLLSDGIINSTRNKISNCSEGKRVW